MKTEPKSSLDTKKDKIMIGNQLINELSSGTKQRTQKVLELKKPYEEGDKIAGTIFKVDEKLFEILIKGHLFDYVRLDNGKKCLINRENGGLNCINVSGTDIIINEILEQDYYMFGKRKCLKVSTSKHDEIFIDINSLKEVIPKEKNSGIGLIEIGKKEFKIGKYKLRNVLSKKAERFRIDTKTMKRVDLKVSGTDYEIYIIGEQFGKIGTQKVVKVKTTKNGWMYVNPDTLNRVDSYINSIDREIKQITDTQIKIKGNIFQPVRIERLERWMNPTADPGIWIFIDSKTLEPVLINENIVVGIKQISKNKYKFTDIEGKQYLLKCLQKIPA